VVESVKPEIDKTPTKRVTSGRSRSPMRERKKSETEVEIEVDGMKELHVTLSPRTPAGDPPEPEELIKALMVRGQFWIGSVLLCSASVLLGKAPLVFVRRVGESKNSYVHGEKKNFAHARIQTWSSNL
jgi:hypothetical protein